MAQFRFILLGFGFFILFACTNIKEIHGNKIISLIEQYRQHNPVLPEDLEQAGINLNPEGPLFYRKISDDQYELWYGTRLGESRIYNSKQKKWQ